MDEHKLTGQPEDAAPSSALQQPETTEGVPKTTAEQTACAQENESPREGEKPQESLAELFREAEAAAASAPSPKRHIQKSSRKTDTRTVALIIGLVICIVGIVGVIVIGVLKASGTESKNPQETRNPQETASTELAANGLDALSTDSALGESQSAAPTGGDSGNPGAPATAGQNTTIDISALAEQISLPPKTGDNLLSDEPDNEFIALVHDTYGADTNCLVAVYSVPDKGNNFVLQFLGTRDKNGKVIKSPATLVKVYQVDAERNICIATGRPTGNVGVSYAEGYIVVSLVKDIIMPQYPDYFTGVDKS